MYIPLNSVTLCLELAHEGRIDIRQGGDIQTLGSLFG